MVSLSCETKQPRALSSCVNDIIFRMCEQASRLFFVKNNLGGFFMNNEEIKTAVAKIIKIRCLTEKTATAYLKMCDRFLSWCDNKEIVPEQINYEQIQDYVLYLMEDMNYAPRTINSNISFIKMFFIYIIHRPIDRYLLPYCKIDQVDPEVLSKQEVAQFIKALPNLKAKAMITLLYSCGLRSNELVNLKYSDISRARMTVYIRDSKNRTSQHVPLSASALNILSDYWKNCGRPMDWLFPGHKSGCHISKASVSSIIKNTTERLHWENRKITPHLFRHCIGTHMYEAGYDLPYIQKFMRHKCITSTMIYITLSGKTTYENPFESIAGELI